MTDRNQIPSEHRELQFCSDRLRVIAACPSEILPDRRWRDLLVREVGEYATRLSNHLTREEALGLFDEIAEVSPRLARQVDKLRDQHAEIRALLDRLVLGVERDVDGARDTTATLLDLVNTHEREESAALQDALLTDEGGRG